MLGRVEAFLNGLLALSQLLERLLVDVVSAFTPWLAPLVPAYLVYSNLITLGMPSWVAVSAAVAVECLGLSSINTALSLWRYNDERRQSDRAAPFGVALLAGAFYIAVVITVNSILDMDANGATVRTLAYALLSLLSVVSGVIIAIRAQHARRLADIVRDKAEAREHRRELREERQHDTDSTRIARMGRSPASSGPQTARNAPDIRALRAEQFAAVRAAAANRNGDGFGAADIRALYPELPERTIYNFLGRINEEQSPGG